LVEHDGYVNWAVFSRTLADLLAAEYVALASEPKT
jgi:hypothetical protein